MILLCCPRGKNMLKHYMKCSSDWLVRRLTVNLTKCEFAKVYVTYLSKRVVCPVDAKIVAITEFPRPTNKRELCHFIRMAGSERSFMPPLISNALSNLRLMRVWLAPGLSFCRRLKWTSRGRCVTSRKSLIAVSTNIAPLKKRLSPYWWHWNILSTWVDQRLLPEFTQTTIHCFFLIACTMQTNA